MGVMLLVVGCQTMDTRIAENPALWNSFSPEEQARIRDGKLWEGMTTEAVWLAWGKPRYKRHGQEGAVDFEEWVYTRIRSQDVMEWRYRQAYNGRDWYLVPEYAPTQVYDEVPASSVRFIDGKVTAWSTLTR